MYTLVGHRGFPAQYPENTLSSIEAAIQSGVKAVEFDVQGASDGTPYVFHDETLERLTSHAGIIYNHTPDELAKLSAHYPDRFDKKFLGEPICTLEQMMELLCDYPDVEAFIEPKSHSIDHFGISAFMDSILDASECLGERRRMISFHHQALAYARQPKGRVGCDNIVWVLDDFSEASEKIAQALQPDTLCADIAILPEHLPNWGNFDWMIYPMDNADKLERYANMGIQYIETDDVGTLIQAYKPE